MLSFLKRISANNQIVRRLSTTYEDVLNQNLNTPSEGTRYKKTKRPSLNKRVFSLEQSIEERKEAVLTEIKLLEERGFRVPSKITELHWKLLTSEPNRVVYNIM